MEFNSVPEPDSGEFGKGWTDGAAKVPLIRWTYDWTDGPAASSQWATPVLG